jgi:pantoate--beta-alanine ligase
MELVRTNQELHAWRSASGGHAFVPTMGALHEGHLALIRHGVDQSSRRAMAGGCIVSIFVNPTQFNEFDDFEAYPQNLDRDLELCRRAGAACVYAPGTEEVYPPDQTPRTPTLPDVAHQPRLEDAIRPGHFTGVCTVLVRLFDLVRPRVAIFGEKDWQQLQVTRALVRQEGLDIEIAGLPTVRGADAVALSSRNSRLQSEAREEARALPAALQAGAGEPTPATAEAAMLRVLREAGLEVEYAVVRDATTLLAPTTPGPYRALIAVRLAGVHLLDNAPWPADGQ